MKNKQPDLANMFYHKANEKSSDGSSAQHSKKSIPTIGRTPGQFTLTKKINMIANSDSASTSRERTLRLKKQSQHGQLQNNLKESAVGGSAATAANSFQNS